MSDTPALAQSSSPLFTRGQWIFGIACYLPFAGLLYVDLHNHRLEQLYFPAIFIVYGLLNLYFAVRRHYRPGALPEPLSTDSPLIRRLSRIRKYLFIAGVTTFPIFLAISWLSVSAESYLGSTHPFIVQKITIIYKIVDMEHPYWMALFFSIMAVVWVLSAYIAERTTVTPVNSKSSDSINRTGTPSPASQNP